MYAHTHMFITAQHYLWYQKIGNNLNVHRLSNCSNTVVIWWNSIAKIPSKGLPWWRSGWESACQDRGHGFNPWSGKIPHAVEQLGPCATATDPVLWSPWATTAEPACRNYWGPRAWSPCSTAREATVMRSPRTAMKSSLRSLQLEKARAQQRRPNAAKNK